MRAVLLLLALSVPRAALGQTVDVDTLVRDGLDLRRQRRDAEALSVFQRAWAISHAPRERAQMGFAEQALGHWIDAEVYLREARSATSDPWIAERAAVIDDALREVARHLGDLDVQGNVPGAEVRVDGRAVGTLPFARPVRAPVGTVSLEVSAARYHRVRRDVRVSAGELARESVVLVPLAGAGGPADPAATRRVLAWAAAGGAAVGLGVGVAGLIARNAAADRWNSNACLAGGQPREVNCAVHGADGRSAELVSGVGFVLGGALAVTSAVLFLTLPGRAPAAYRARYGCGPGPGDLGVACGGAL